MGKHLRTGIFIIEEKAERQLINYFLKYEGIGGDQLFFISQRQRKTKVGARKFVVTNKNSEYCYFLEFDIKKN